MECVPDTVLGAKYKAVNKERRKPHLFIYLFLSSFISSCVFHLLNWGPKDQREQDSL